MPKPDITVSVKSFPGRHVKAALSGAPTSPWIPLRYAATVVDASAVVRSPMLFAASCPSCGDLGRECARCMGAGA